MNPPTHVRTGRVDLLASTCIYLCFSSPERHCSVRRGSAVTHQGQASEQELQSCRVQSHPAALGMRTVWSRATSKDSAAGSTRSVSLRATQEFLHKHHQLPALSHLSRKTSLEQHPGGSCWLHRLSLGFHGCPRRGEGDQHLHQATSLPQAIIPSTAAPQAASTH